MKENLPADYPSNYFSQMLRTVLEDFFSSINQERDFDFPFMSLLAAMGYYDIHFTHGSREMGKDFIAKREIDGIEYQYAFQSKKGDINQKQCTDEVLPQLLLASVTGLSHPQFDRSLSRHVVLVSTGRLVGNAPLILQDFNDTLQRDYQRNSVEFWGTNHLIPMFEEFGLASIHKLTAEGVKGFAEFFVIYSKSLDGKLSDNEIEAFSQLWLDEALDYRKRILRASIEAEIVAVKLMGNGLIYETLILYIALTRTVMRALYEAEDELLKEVYRQILEENIIALCRRFQSQVKDQWELNDKQMLSVIGVDVRTLPMLHYLVWCSRILTVSSLLFFLTSDQKEKETTSAFIKDFTREEGCGHPPSDRYAAALVWPILALIKSGDKSAAVNLIKRAVVWLCDRMEHGFGLASYDAKEYEETAVLVGFPFSAVTVHKNNGSFLATVLADLAAFTNDGELYEAVVNDFAACEIAYEYWQLPDTKAVCTIFSEESRNYPNSVHDLNLTKLDDYNYAEHIREEPSHFKIIDKLGFGSLILLSVLLRDRYFPKVWPGFLK
jgi:hypothetical protein